MTKKAVVELTRNAQKDLKKLPRFVLVLFDEWVETVETVGYQEMQKVHGYNDHSLKGKRVGQRSSYLNRSYRVIYELKEKNQVQILEVQEVNKHEYKK